MADPLHHPKGAHFISTGKEEDELLPAVASDLIALSGAFLKSQGHLADHIIPCKMPMLIIHPFEIVDIQDDQSESLILPSALAVAVQKGEEGGMVQKASHGIQTHMLCQGLIGCLKIPPEKEGLSPECQEDAVQNQGQEEEGKDIDAGYAYKILIAMEEWQEEDQKQGASPMKDSRLCHIEIQKGRYGNNPHDIDVNHVDVLSHKKSQGYSKEKA